VDRIEVGITVILITLKHIHVFLKKSAPVGNTVKKIVKYIMGWRHLLKSKWSLYTWADRLIPGLIFCE